MKAAPLHIIQNFSLIEAFDSMTNGVMIINQQLQILYVNEALHNICQRDPYAEKNNWCRSYGIYYPDGEKLYRHSDLPIVRALEGEHVDEQLLFLKNKTIPEGRFVTCNARPVKESGNIVGAILTVRDVTKTIEREKSLEEHKKKLERTSHLISLGMMLAELGHEIKNPLTVINNSAWLMEKLLEDDSCSKEELQSKVTDIKRMVKKIDDIIRSVGNCSRDGSHDKQDEHSLKLLIDDVISICGPRMDQNQIQFNFDLDSEVPGEIFCNRTKFTQVLTNIICNAIDAVSEAKIKWITLQIFVEEDCLVFRIYDSGPGVSPAHEAKIFQNFFTTKEYERGTGLGLCISKNIVAEHSGSLTLNTEISRSCFEVRVPAQMKQLKTAN